jgi:hypothetical protein
MKFKVDFVRNREDRMQIAYELIASKYSKKFTAIIGQSRGEIEDLRDYFNLKGGFKEGKDVMYLIQYSPDIQMQLDDF